MQIFAIGNDSGPVEIGVTKNAKALAKERDLPLIKSHELGRGWDDLALTIATFCLPRKPTKNGANVYAVPALVARNSLEKAIRATQVSRKRQKPLFGDAIKKIRLEVFRTTQECFGEIAGCSGAKVSRWESDEIIPDLAEIAQLRLYAAAHGLRWDDAFIFHNYVDR